MTARPRRVPPDMLLIAERKRKAAAPASGTHIGGEIFVSDEDQLIEASPAAELGAAAGAAGELLLTRPVEYVSLAQVGWSSPIDHDALQAALRCYPADDVATVPLFEAAPFSKRGALPALEVTLHASDLAVSKSAAEQSPRAAHLIRALCLPERISHAQADTAHALSPVLAAYRRASLEYAWHTYLGESNNTQLRRERDEAAVAVLSTLRALLGER